MNTNQESTNNTFSLADDYYIEDSNESTDENSESSSSDENSDGDMMDSGDEESEKYSDESSEEEEGEEGPSETACAYCMNDDPDAVAQCMVCKKWFCNSRCRSGSHIVQHLIYSEHKSIRIHPDGLQKEMGDSPICCFNNPSHNNIFTLGTIHNDNGYSAIICRDRCLDRQRLKEYGWDADTWEHLIHDRHIANFLLSDSPPSGRYVITISSKDIRRLEDLWKSDPSCTVEDLLVNPEQKSQPLERVPISFGSAKVYESIFSPLVNLECESDKQENDSKCINDVTLRWEKGVEGSTVVVFHNMSSDSRYRMSIGQVLTFHLPLPVANLNQEVSFTGKVILLDKTEVHVLVKKEGSLPSQTSGYHVTFEWNGVSFSRMLSAIQSLYDTSCMSETLYNIIMGNDFSMKNLTCPPIESISIDSLPVLNTYQVNAVRAALQNHLTLIQGPPGTGKTGRCVMEVSCSDCSYDRKSFSTCNASEGAGVRSKQHCSG